MTSRKNKWRKRGRFEFRRETSRYDDGTPTGSDTLYIRVRRVACTVVQPFEIGGKVDPDHSVSVLLGTYRLCRPSQAAHLARDYLLS